MKRILQLDGGGCKGIMQAYWLRYIEQKTGKPIFKTFDLIVGTSIGAIVGALAARGVSGEDMVDEMYNILPKIFKKRFRIPFRQPKYKRSTASKFLGSWLGKDTKMKELGTDLMVTSVNMVDGRNHFFKSWESKDGGLDVVDVVNRSYAAPLFFGGIVDNEAKAVWLDGGTGNMNCPLDYAIIEAFRQGWIQKEEGTYILSLGTGSHKLGVPWKKARKSRNLKQVGFFIDPKDGGLAREQGTASKVALAHVINKKIRAFGIKRVDVKLPAKIDTLDGVKYLDSYIDAAGKVCHEIPIDKLK